ncbi:MUC18 Gicerin Melanoma cell adhesion molecule Melanoma-associated antigen [Triplophysa tibetana]|uniref:MUC18 Gicerin Melanoma cell adhesion molecule Melanoma-associated antigen n=1 Tax=Triplophysa tibetana TaxID=1572043 RepID=A0A5A9N0B8_9TELE|nr:MUC18 Gicerin Melanoma cell adhesion molecule Melanoma-associated antigen [Triplophysa tibetana]
MDPRYVALLVAGLLVLTCKTWALVEVSMEDRVEVFLNKQASIPCVYHMKEKAMIIKWYKKLPGDGSKVLFIIEGELREINDKDYTGRISYTHSYNSSKSQGSIVLTIDKVQLSDEAEIICIVQDNTLKNQDEGHTQLQVFNPPSFPAILGTDRGISVDEELSMVANCKVDNVYPRPNITWYKGTFPLQSSKDVKIIDRVTRNPSGLFTLYSDLHLNVVREDEHAEFYCEVNYFTPGEKRMMESDKINIEVFYPTTEVTMWVNPPKKLLKEGDTMEIGCKGNGNPQPIFTIYNNKNEVSSENELVVFKEVKRSDTGKYMCEILNFDTGTVFEGSIDIMIHYLDEIVVTPEKRVLDQGEDLTLTCNALASLSTHTEWYKDGVHVLEGHVLKSHNASSNTEGTYLCKVTVVSLPELQKQTSLHINVRANPKITEEIVVSPRNKGDHSFNLTCFAQGYPIPNITWQINDLQTGEPLNESSVEYHEKGVGVLSIISVKADSEFTANCTAFNELGITSRSRYVTTFDQGPTTTTATHTKGITVPPKQHQKGGSGVVIAVVIICLLLLAILGSFLYFLYKKGRLPCGRSGKQDFTKENANKDETGMKSGKSEEAVLLQGVNGDKKSPTE